MDGRDGRLSHRSNSLLPVPETLGEARDDIFCVFCTHVIVNNWLGTYLMVLPFLFHLHDLLSNCFSSLKWVLRKHPSFSFLAYSHGLVPEFSEPVNNYVV